MQATRLLQHNNPPQNKFPTSQVYIEFYKFLTRIYFAQVKFTTFRNTHIYSSHSLLPKPPNTPTTTYKMNINVRIA